MVKMPQDLEGHRQQEMGVCPGTEIPGAGSVLRLGEKVPSQTTRLSLLGIDSDATEG